MGLSAVEWAAVLALVVLGAEAAVTLRAAGRPGRPSRLAVAASGVAGAALIAAVVAAGRGGPEAVTLGLLALAGVAHAGETWARWTGD